MKVVLSQFKIFHAFVMLGLIKHEQACSILFTRSSLASLPLDLDFFELEALTFAASRLVFKNISFQNLLNISNQKCCFTKYIHKV